MKTFIIMLRRRMWICIILGGLLLVGGSCEGADFDLLGLNAAQFGGFLILCVASWVVHFVRHFEAVMNNKLEQENLEIKNLK